MCGFIALLDQAMSVRCEQAEEAINRALQLMGHRGPDETKLYSDEQIKIGFNRLSIIDINDSQWKIIINSEKYQGQYQEKCHQNRSFGNIEKVCFFGKQSKQKERKKTDNKKHYHKRKF